MTSNQKVLSSPTLKLGQALKTNKAVKIIEIISVFMVAAGLIYLFRSDDPQDLLYNQFVIWCANIVMLAMVFTGMKLRGENLSEFGLSFNKFNLNFALRTFLQSLVVFMVAIAAYILGSIVMANITGIPESADHSVYNFIQGNLAVLVLSLAGVYIVSSFGEEVLYRAFLINRISALGSNTKTARIIAALISSLIFGLAHYSWGPMGIVQTSFMGFALGCSYLYLRRKIWVLIMAHAYMDTILLVQLYLS